MKIGLLTYHAVCNFGANLQALSTVSFLRKRGCDVWVINWYPTDIELYYKRIVSIGQQLVHESFVKERFQLTKRCFDLKDVSDVVRTLRLDAIIVGSDAVFSYIPYLKRLHLSRKTGLALTKVTSDHRLPNPFFADFDFTPELKIFAMSASAQFLDIGRCFPWEKKRLSQSLKKFSMISVRDRWTQSVVQSLIGRKPEITPDPVFAFNENVSFSIGKEEIMGRYAISKSYVILSFCSRIFDEQWFSSLYETLHGAGYMVVNLAMPEGCVELPCDVKIDVPLSPMDWYAIIKYSNGYIGQRMHPMIVAFHNLVPFFIFDHYAYKKGEDQLLSSKIYDLLERADMLSSYCNIREKETLPNADYVCACLQHFSREKAEKFITAYKAKYVRMMDEILNAI